MNEARQLKLRSHLLTIYGNSVLPIYMAASPIKLFLKLSLSIMTIVKPITMPDDDVTNY